MIEDKKAGLKFAESEEEAAWYHTSENTVGGIKMLEDRIKRAEKDLTLSDREIGQKFRNGAKALIKKAKTEIEIQKEILKLANSKIRKV